MNVMENNAKSKTVTASKVDNVSIGHDMKSFNILRFSLFWFGCVDAQETKLSIKNFKSFISKLSIEIPNSSKLSIDSSGNF
jgi:hypothetical protein